MALKLSNQDKKDLDKFTKFLALKAIQVIVQSRLGEPISTPCKPQTAGTDWFNLAINDLPDVLAEAKRVLNGEIITARLPLCVEISLRTIDGDTMVLETWCLGILPEQCDPSNRAIHTVYNRMGILLKSLLSVTRVTPAYKLSRRQGPSTYVICYRIYLDKPQLHNLGDGYKQVRIGQLCTPIGTLQLSVSYRMKMTLTPNNSKKEKDGKKVLVESNHFDVTLSPKHLRYKKHDEKSASLSDRMKMGAFADTNRKYIEPEIIIPTVSFSKLLMERLTPEKRNGEAIEEEEEQENEKCLRNGKEDANGNSPTDSQKSDTTLTMMSTNDDFIMVELKTPFASTNVNSELGMFYREWQSAPPLQAFVELPTVAEQVHDLTEQLESFESDMREYDDVLQLLQVQPSNNN